MTKDRARKQATRQRATLTGERYVVAQRATAETQPQPRPSGRLHTLTHQVPGVPAHVDGGLQATRSGGRNAQHVPHKNPEHAEPRVLAGWQNWFARRFRVGNR